MTGDTVDSSPTLTADGTVYIGSEDFKIYALDAATGAKKWEYLTDYWVESGPAVGPDGTVFVLGWDSRVYALAGISPLALSPWPKFRARSGNQGAVDSSSAAPITLEALGFSPKGFTMKVVSGLGERFMLPRILYGAMFEQRIGNR